VRNRGSSDFLPAAAKDRRRQPAPVGPALGRQDDPIAPMLTGRRRAPAGTTPMTKAPLASLVLATAAASGMTIRLIASAIH
jgi:hypothetical protein